ncbi:GMC oxidoreductase [Flagelloscypha sp. PMI_526]|nr:GMC oxidoreductase [Flagelloscypha sp. PMI_526]
MRTRRNLVDAPRSDAYDIVVVGGGTAGLVLGSRISDNSNLSVLVIEAGKSRDDVRSQIDYPQSTYYTSLVGTEYDWKFTTQPQGSGGNRQFSWPRGKVLGGSTAINGMYMTRPHRTEVEAWEGIISPQDSSAASKWGWDSFSAAIKTSETFHTPSADLANSLGFTYDTSYHGSSGPVHHSIPAVTRPVITSWLSSLSNIGVPPCHDPASGDIQGGYISPVSLNAGNWSRSYARAAYIDPLPPRSNLDIITGQTVTRILFNTANPPVATGVEYAAASGAEKKTVGVKKEVVMAAGVIGSPQILMTSGVGPKDIVQGASVTSVLDLAGVGHHLQDHIKAGVVFKALNETSGDVHAKNDAESNSTEFRSYVSSALAYVNMTTLLGTDGAAAVIQSATDALSTASSLVPSGSTEVVEGFKTQYTTTLDFFKKDTPQIELLLTDMFPGTITLQAGIQHPLSAGRLYINSSSSFDSPVIDPEYLALDTDRAILREGMKLARKLGQTDPLKSYLGDEQSPGASVDTDEAWDAWIAQNGVTEYHPCCTCAMMPKEKGGVVDAQLKVYGLSNVRVVDASVYPFSLSTHLMTPTYGLAEQGAQIILSAYSGSSSTGQSSQSNPTSSPSSSNSASMVVTPPTLSLLLVFFAFALRI